MTSYFTSPSAPTLLPYFAIFQFVYSHLITSPRFAKLKAGIDNNACPRQDMERYGKAALAAGKMTQRDLDRIYRMQAAHENAIENLPFFLFSVLLAQYAKVPNATINKVCLFYAFVRFLYTVGYVTIEKRKYALARSSMWWAGNITCFYTLYQTGKRLNAGL